MKICPMKWYQSLNFQPLAHGLIRNGVRKLHYIERIDHFHDESVKAHIHLPQYIFYHFIPILFFFNLNSE